MTLSRSESSVLVSAGAESFNSPQKRVDNRSLRRSLSISPAGRRGGFAAGPRAESLDSAYTIGKPVTTRAFPSNVRTRPAGLQRGEAAARWGNAQAVTACLAVPGTIRRACTRAACRCGTAPLAARAAAIRAGAGRGHSSRAGSPGRHDLQRPESRAGVTVVLVRPRDSVCAVNHVRRHCSLLEPDFDASKRG
jgi:hypothetical protein